MRLLHSPQTESSGESSWDRSLTVPLLVSFFGAITVEQANQSIILDSFRLLVSFRSPMFPTNTFVLLEACTGFDVKLVHSPLADYMWASFQE